MRQVNSCFSRSERLLSPADYKRVFGKPGKSTDNYFTVLCRANGGSGARLGLAIAKKNLPRAVDRNLVKRIIRESFRQHKQELAGLDLVVLCRQSIPLGDRRALADSLSRHWRSLAARFAGS